MQEDVFGSTNAPVDTVKSIRAQCWLLRLWMHRDKIMRISPITDKHIGALATLFGVLSGVAVYLMVVIH